MIEEVPIEEEKPVVLADFRETIHTIGVDDQDRNYQKLSWWENPVWLKQPVEGLPVAVPTNDEDEILVEEDKATATAWMHRFIPSFKMKRNPIEGDCVLVGDSSRRISERPLGLNKKTIPEKGSKVRVVRVKTSHETLTSTLQRLYLMTNKIKILRKDKMNTEKVEVKWKKPPGVDALLRNLNVMDSIIKLVGPGILYH
ncbi:unnamed protein product [Orchesella dallaii]|uniref:Uncharacterized protein n=1 Tax=Orchesella dallaii TaxID=48710 RepID=A0ABP1RH97_9HEXA